MSNIEFKTCDHCGYDTFGNPAPLMVEIGGKTYHAMCAKEARDIADDARRMEDR
jgi:hypothetical protein